jgi:hypothetical protein
MYGWIAGVLLISFLFFLQVFAGRWETQPEPAQPSGVQGISMDKHSLQK